jgi:hypothetical protein
MSMDAVYGRVFMFAVVTGEKKKSVGLEVWCWKECECSGVDS